jgi:hypothetical protein
MMPKRAKNQKIYNPVLRVSTETTVSGLTDGRQWISIVFPAPSTTIYSFVLDENINFLYKLYAASRMPQKQAVFSGFYSIFFSPFVAFWEFCQIFDIKYV